MGPTRKMYYCKNCKKAYIKSMFEYKTCDFCRSKCIEIKVPYPVYTLLAWMLLIIACILILVFPDLDFYWKIMIVLAALGPSLVFLAVGVGIMKKTAEKMGEEIAIKTDEKRTGKRKKNR